VSNYERGAYECALLEFRLMFFLSGCAVTRPLYLTEFKPRLVIDYVIDFQTSSP